MANPFARTSLMKDYPTLAYLKPGLNSYVTKKLSIKILKTILRVCFKRLSYVTGFFAYSATHLTDCSLYHLYPNHYHIKFIPHYQSLPI
jgi:hypothetical protein